MGKCKNTVSQFIPKGFDYKEVELPCGSTSIQGGVLLCDGCEHVLEKAYLQGWRNHPGDICEHGHYVGDPCGPDYMCPICEGL